MDKIYRIIKGLGYMIYFTDYDADLLYAIGDKEVLRDFEDNLNFTIGVNWSERIVGTTAIGMVIAKGDPVPFMAEEKYCLEFKKRACSAVPIKNDRGNIVGVLGTATSCSRIDKINCQIFGLLVAAEMAIENQLQILEKNRKFQMINYYYKTVFDSVSDAIVTIDGKGNIMDMNKRAGEILTIDPKESYIFSEPG